MLRSKYILHPVFWNAFPGKFWISNIISLKCVYWGLNSIMSVGVQILVWRKKSNKPFPELMWSNSVDPRGVTRPQWVNSVYAIYSLYLVYHINCVVIWKYVHLWCFKGEGNGIWQRITALFYFYSDVLIPIWLQFKLLNMKAYCCLMARVAPFTQQAQIYFMAAVRWDDWRQISRPFGTKLW